MARHLLSYLDELVGIDCSLYKLFLEFVSLMSDEPILESESAILLLPEADVLVPEDDKIQ